MATIANIRFKIWDIYHFDRWPEAKCIDQYALQLMPHFCSFYLHKNTNDIYRSLGQYISVIALKLTYEVINTKMDRKYIKVKQEILFERFLLY